MHVCLSNCHSIKNKAQSVKDYFVEFDIIILGITEIWLSKGGKRESCDQRSHPDRVPFSIMSPAQRAVGVVLRPRQNGRHFPDGFS